MESIHILEERFPGYAAVSHDTNIGVESHAAGEMSSSTRSLSQRYGALGVCSVLDIGARLPGRRYWCLDSDI